MNTPSAAQIRSARHTSGLTQRGAAALVHLRAPQRWAEYENGARRIDLARWELFLLKTGLHERAQIINGMIVIAKE